MKQKIIKQINYWLGVTAIGLVLGFSLQFVRAWTEPTVAPPGGNVGAPLNTSNLSQLKIGGLILNVGGAPTGLLVHKGNVGIGTPIPSGKFSVGSAAGENAYFFYDNADVGDDVDGQVLSVNRRALEGDSWFNLYIDQYNQAQFNSNRTMFFNSWNDLYFQATGGLITFNGIMNTNNNWISGDGGAEGISIDDSGKVGIGTPIPGAVHSDPNKVKLDMGNSIITGVATPIDSEDAVNRAYVDAAGGGGAVFAGYTPAKYNGNLGGLTGANAKCNAAFPSSHICSVNEFARTGNTTLLGWGGAWLLNDGYAVGPVWDMHYGYGCMSFTNTAAGFEGMSVDSSGLVEWRGCWNIFYISCCK